MCKQRDVKTLVTLKEGFCEIYVNAQKFVKLKELCNFFKKMLEYLTQQIFNRKKFLETS